MEATGRDGGRGPSLMSYRRHEETGIGSSSYTISSSRSGTIVSSTAYTSSRSRLSVISMDAALQLDMEFELRLEATALLELEALRLGTKDAEFAQPMPLESESQPIMEPLESESALRLGTKDAEFAQPIMKPCKKTEETLKDKKDAEFFELSNSLFEGTKDAEFARPIMKPRKKPEETFKDKRMKHIESLVQESENLSIKCSGDMGALESLFSELGVSWVLQLDAGASALVLGHPPVGDTGSWIRALTQIMETIHLTKSFSPDHGQGFVGMPAISEEGVEGLFGSHPGLHPVQFALFFHEAMSKMLVYVDAMFSKSLSKHGPPYISNSLLSCLDIHNALFSALSGIRLQFHSSTPAAAEVVKIEKEMVSLLTAKQGMACVAIWSALEETRTRVLSSMEDLSGTQSPQGSSDIHEATYSLMDYITFLLHNQSVTLLLVFKAVSLGKYVPQIEVVPPLISFIIEMVSCHEEKLITKSQLFLDKGLGLLFLLNNSNFIWEQLQDTPSSITVNVQLSSRKDELGHYIESYIQVSWAPMSSCLSNHTPLCLGRNYSPLSKFESEFQKIYTAQKLWKVPDPGLRKRLRKAVIEKVIPGYTKYIEDSKVTNPKFTPQELEEMLQELFEG